MGGELGGKGEMYNRNTSEEMFLKTIMDNSIGMPVPTMEMLGFKNISSLLHHHHHPHPHNFRIDSEELFKTWLTNGDQNHDSNSPSIALRTRQASKRISTELANTTTSLQKRRSNDVIFTQTDYPVPLHDTPSSDLNHQSLRNSIDKTAQASNLYLAKAWFHTSQPMTRSRSSELRKRYAAMQSAQTSSGNGPSNLRQGFVDPIHDIGSGFMPTLNPNPAPPQMGDVDRVSSVVSMLKGTLERKKLVNQTENENAQHNSYDAIYHAQGVLMNSSFDQEKAQTSQEISSSQVNDADPEMDLEGFINPMNPIHHQLITFSREASQSESSAAAPASGFDACDDPSISSQTLNTGEKPVENNTSPEKGPPQPKDFRERIIENLKDDRKRGGLVRYGSVTSTGSVEKGDPTKKRRVERSRKMAEAKERNSTPVIPSDMQSVLKRCENLEKEVRSLKLNLSFMNRKDSEQTKQIEDLQQKNDELADEKERLLEEIERILSETGKL